jgi:protein TonB
MIGSLKADRHDPASPMRPDVTDPPAGSPSGSRNGVGRDGGERKRPVKAARTGGRLMTTLLVSVGLHAATVIAVVLLLNAGVPVADAPSKPAQVELVMEEHRGDLHPPAAPPQAETAPPRETKPTETHAASPPVQTEQTEAPSYPSDPAPSAMDATIEQAQPPPATETAVTDARPNPAPTVKATPTAAAEPQVQDVPPNPAPPVAQPTPKISLEGTDSPSDARAWGDRIIPAAPDAVFHNRPPEYPRDAAMNGEHGIVVVLIHVSPAGTADGVDLLRSSGYLLLDSAARQAVLRWRFLPAVKDGHPVASEMQMGFEFANE